MITPEALNIITVSLKVALVATMIDLLPAVFMGWFMSRCHRSIYPIINLFVFIPIVLPPVAIGLILLHALSPNYVMGHFLTQLIGSPLLLTWYAASISSAIVGFPFFVKSIEQRFNTVGKRYSDLALILGVSKKDLVIKIVAPLLMPAVISGGCLCFARALGEFGATVIVAGNIPGKTQTLALGIYSQIVSGNLDEAWKFVGISIAITAVMVLSALLIDGRGEMS